MAKSVKEKAELAMKFAENMIKQKKAAIDAGTLEGQELEDAKNIVAEFENLQEDFKEEVQNFCSVRKFAAVYSDCIDDNNAMVFAIIRKLVESLADSEGNHDELFDAIRQKLTDYDIEEVALTSCINHVAKLKGLDYSQNDDDCYDAYMKVLADHPEVEAKVASMEVTPENVLELISNNYTKVLKFAAGKTGMDIIRSGIGFLEQIRNRMASAEDPDEEEIAEYSKAIAEMNSFCDEYEKKDFSARMPKCLRMFVETVCANDQICSILDAISDLDFTLQLESQTESTDCYFVSNGNKFVNLNFNKDAEGNLTEILGISNGDIETLDTDNVREWLIEKLGSEETEVTVDSETGEVI